MERTSPQVIERLQSVVATMRDFLDDFERELARGDRRDEDMIHRAVHTLAWGNANASQGISAALRFVVYRQELCEAVNKEPSATG